MKTALAMMTMLSFPALAAAEDQRLLTTCHTLNVTPAVEIQVRQWGDWTNGYPVSVEFKVGDAETMVFPGHLQHMNRPLLHVEFYSARFNDPGVLEVAAPVASLLNGYVKIGATTLPLKCDLVF